MLQTLTHVTDAVLSVADGCMQNQLEADCSKTRQHPTKHDARGLKQSACIETYHVQAGNDATMQ